MMRSLMLYALHKIGLGQSNLRECKRGNVCTNLERVRATMVAVERLYVLHIMMCVCSLAFFISKAPYCHLRPALLYNIFSNYLTKCMIFEKKSY
jgi:hypothetical protein